MFLTTHGKPQCSITDTKTLEVGKAELAFWTWVWPAKHCGMGREKWLVDFNAGKTQFVTFDQSNNSDVIDVKMDGSALEEKSSFKMAGIALLF